MGEYLSRVPRRASEVSTLHVLGETMERSYGFPSSYFHCKMRLYSEIQTDIKNFSAPEFDTTYDPAVRKSKGTVES